MLIVDRVEGAIAVCEGETGRQELPLESLPEGVREGDCLRWDGAGWTVDREETRRRRTLNHSRAGALFGRKKPDRSDPE